MSTSQEVEISDEPGIPNRRSSTRNPAAAFLLRIDVQNLLSKVESNHTDTIVLKIKDHLSSDVNSSIFEALINSLWKNHVCQALYIQNLNDSITDRLLERLIDLLYHKMIWCLNIGENYAISIDGWIKFTKALPKTNVTHLYVSEHIIKIDLKNEMRDYIRENRKKHQLHCSLSNLSVIERCTHCWWNPINSIRHALEGQKDDIDESKKPKKIISSHEKKRKSLPSSSSRFSSSSSPSSYSSSDFIYDYSPPKSTRRHSSSSTPHLSSSHTSSSSSPSSSLNPSRPEFWAQGREPGGEKAWKFRCICGETCSSYENHRYHPTGRMFECTGCTIWSHVDCVLGRISEEELEEMKYVLCARCESRARRERQSMLIHAHETGTEGIGEERNRKGEEVEEEEEQEEEDS